MLFSELVEFYERIEATTGRIEMTNLLVDLLKRTPPEIVDKVVYLTIGEIYPPCLLYTSPSPRDRTRSRMPSSA